MSEFKREYFVKDLYNPNTVLEQFHPVEFENPQAFAQALAGGYHYLKGAVVVGISNFEEFKYMRDVITTSRIVEQPHFHLILRFLNAMDNAYQPLWDGLAEKKFEIFVPLSFKFEQQKTETEFIQWRKKNRIWAEFDVTFDHIDTIIEEVISVYQHYHTRFFKPHINYDTFEHATFADIHRIRYKWSRLQTWAIATRDNKPNKTMGLWAQGGFTKEIFISEKLKLYYNRHHFEQSPDTPLLQLIRGNGENLQFREMNRFLRYADLKPEYMIPKIEDPMKAWLIDFWENEKIHLLPNEIPMITQQFMEWWQP